MNVWSLALAGIFVVTGLTAESVRARTPIAIGIEAGATMSIGTRTQFAATYGFDQKTKLGAGAGALVSMSPFRPLAFQAELLITQKNMRDAQPGQYSTEEIFRLRYLEIPVVVRLTPTFCRGRLRPTIFGGGFVSFLLAAKGTYRGHNDPSYDGDFDLKGWTNAHDLGITFGGGIGIKAGKGELFCNARYDFGMVNIHAQTFVPFHQSWFDYLRTTIIMVGYKLEI